MSDQNFDAIIVGGGYAGLSAALTLGRSLRKVLVIDSGKPCNRFTPHSHNFLTHDGHTPAQIAMEARKNIERYKTVSLHNGLATTATKAENLFSVNTSSGELFTCKKLILATGLTDIMPDIAGFEACWGKSVIHCPYCHGFEFAGEATGMISNGEEGYHYAGLITNWTKELTLFTNGPATFTDEQRAKLTRKNIAIVEEEIERIQHDEGNVQGIQTKNGKSYRLNAIYNKPKQIQQSEIPQQLGCEFTEQGLIKVDDSRKTSVEGVFACGDNSSWRSVATAVYTGALSGAMVNVELLKDEF